MLLLLLVAFLSSRVDLEISRMFFKEGSFENTPFLKFIYNYGIIPGWLLAILGLVALCKKGWRREGIYLVLVLAIGSGLIAHFFLKEGWPRPRPKQVEEFGGHVPFHPLYAPRFGSDGPFRSLPSGHATMGFYFLALIPIGRKWNSRVLIWAGILGALILGSVLSYTRIAQGGHFFTDTLVSLLVMGGTAFCLTPILGCYETSDTKTT